MINKVRRIAVQAHSTGAQYKRTAPATSLAATTGNSWCTGYRPYSYKPYSYKPCSYRYPEINLQLKIPPAPFRKGGDRGG